MDKPATTDYPVHELIARRWSPRAFEPRAVSAAQLRSMLEAVRWSASCFNEQPWRMLVAGRDNEEAFATMLGCLAEANQSWARHAGALMLAVARQTFTHNDRPNRVALYDLGLGIGSLTFQATDLGLVVHQMAGIDADKIRKSYGIPAGFDPITAIAIGYAGDAEALSEELQTREKAARERKAQSEFVFDGAWERPARW